MAEPLTPAAEATLTSMTEDEMAAWRREQGSRVVRHRGRWWWEIRRGFYRPIHTLARLRAEEATRPAPAAWGFHATLRDDDAAAANTALPAHRIANLDEYDEEALASKRRYELRKARSLVELVVLRDPWLLLEQGYEVMRSSIERTGFGRLPSREEFAADVECSVVPGRRFVLAGLIDGDLAGYAECFAVDGVAYYEEMRVRTEALPTNISKALMVEFALICKRSDQIRELMNGVIAPDDETLTAHKERLGFPVAPVPARVSMLPGARLAIRLLAPSSYYRLTGGARSRAAA